MKRTVNIRRCTENDCLFVSKLIRECIKKSLKEIQPQKALAHLDVYFSHENFKERFFKSSVYVAVKNGLIVGTATLKKNRVGAVFVKKEEQNSGIGKKLMAHVERVAKVRKIERLVLWASVNAVPFYEKLGYKRGRPIFKVRGGYMRIMWKSL